MGKTIVPIKLSKGYKIVKGSTTGSNGTSVTFDSTIVAVFYTYRFQSSYYVHGYAVNPSCDFFNDSTLFDNSYPLSEPPSNYRYSSTNYSFEVNISGNAFTFNGNSINECYYVAILESGESAETDVSVFLLNGTTLLTDGTPTTDVADAIQTVETNKYKIKSNALINIDNATYINLSN